MRALTSRRRLGSDTVVAAGILASRLSGLVREAVIGALLGLSPAADAFKAALRIPNVLQNLLGEGVLSASFIPVYSRLVDSDDEEEAGATAGAVAGLLIALTAVLVVVGVVAARPLTLLFAPGFRDDPLRYELTVDLLRIVFPGVGFLVLSAWCLGILNSHRRFFLSYVAPVLWNAAQVAVVVAVAVGGSTDRSLAEGLAWGVLAGGVLQLAVQLPRVRRLVPRLSLSLDRRRPTVQDVLARFGPVLVGRGVVQVAGYVDLVLASLLAAGAVTALTFAQVLYLLPVSVFAMSIAASELPELSRYGRERWPDLRTRLERGLARILFFVAPIAVLYVAAGEEIVAALFQRGEFGPADTRLVWLVTAAYALGLLATTASRLLQNALYALDDPRTPARIAMVRVVLAALVAVAVMFPLDDLTVGSGGSLVRLGAVGIAAGSAVAAWAEYLLLRAALAWRIGTVRLGGGHAWPVLAAALAAGATAAAVSALVGDPHPLLAAPLVLVPAGLIYLAVVRRTGHPDARSLGLGRLDG